jgi:bacterioferritin-associated ferredoxin
MYVCLCTGATRELVAEAVANGAVTSRQVAAACGAGADCGRCRATLRAIISADCLARNRSRTTQPPDALAATGSCHCRRLTRSRPGGHDVTRGRPAKPETMRPFLVG